VICAQAMLSGGGIRGCFPMQLDEPFRSQLDQHENCFRQARTVFEDRQNPGITTQTGYLAKKCFEPNSRIMRFSLMS